jgi:phospholipid-binding lipoprotein MlaA
MPSPSTPLTRLRALLACACVAALLLGGCATNGDPRDPLEPMNRVVYKFNDGVDNLVIRPFASLYREFVAPPIRTGISNLFSNINDVIVALNNLLQGKIPDAINDAGRILVNTTLGVFGVLDVATELGVDKHNEDFGQTLGRWGFSDGPYIVLPFLGPSNVRDTFGWVGDAYAWPVSYLEPNSHRNAIIGLRLITVRADLLEASQILETAALDPYAFVRDAYLQRRRNQVFDGNPPEERNNEDQRRSGSHGPAPVASDPVPNIAPAPNLISGDWQPTPAELEAREPALRPTPAAQSTARELPKQQASVVRLWLAPARN